jgi:hypothetical protein
LLFHPGFDWHRRDISSKSASPTSTGIVLEMAARDKAPAMAALFNAAINCPAIIAGLFQEIPPLIENRQPNECPNNVQPLVPVQPENGSPQRNQRVNIINCPAFKRAEPNPPEAWIVLIEANNNGSTYYGYEKSNS